MISSASCQGEATYQRELLFMKECALLCKDIQNSFVFDVPCAMRYFCKFSEVGCIAEIITFCMQDGLNVGLNDWTKNLLQ